MSKLIVKDLEGPASSSNKIYIASGSQLDIAGSPGGAAAINLAVDAGDVTTGTLSNARLAAGTVVQVITAELTTITVSTSVAGWHDITNFPAATITPTSTDSKILVIWTSTISSYNGSTPTVRIVRDQPSSTTITTVNDEAGNTNLPRGIATAPGYHLGSSTEFNSTQSSILLDSPSTTSATTYKPQWHGRTDGGTWAYTMNSFFAWGNQVYYGAGISTLTLMEIKA
jgi:hypothetical protein